MADWLEIYFCSTKVKHLIIDFLSISALKEKVENRLFIKTNIRKIKKIDCLFR